MTRAERIRLWSALSEVFVDNPVDYGFVARQVAGFDRITVQAALLDLPADAASVSHGSGHMFDQLESPTAL